MFDQQQPCVHRIRIEEQNGSGIVKGVCSKCGFTKAYKSYDDPEIGTGDWAHDVIFGRPKHDGAYLD